ncbi:hypothetical protein F8M41_008268 [Gigaspora margarita]|uniref:Uncharacterized protein n=1 Tax=Gigaspora margarita TaxID=4874 RepID=A0A8H3X3P1_GIGMA|nr:hypothetical protein F8M41_008268 [Gigaspora margarita]
MSSELDLLKQRITELEAENAELRKENTEIPDLRRKLAEIPDLRRKISEFDAERAELKRRIAEALKMTEEERTRRGVENAKLKARIEELESEFRDRITKVEQKQTLNDNSSNNNSSNFNLVADQVPTVTHHERPLVDTSLPEDKEMDAFLDEMHKKKVSNEIRQRNRDKKLQAQESPSISPEEKRPQEVPDSVTQPCNSVTSETSAINALLLDQKLLDSNNKKGKSVDKLKQELFFPETTDSLGETNELSTEQNHVNKISETAGPGKSNIDEASQHLAQLCDKAFDAEYGANRANQEEILCWCLYPKDYKIQLNEIIENSEGKFGEKKARSLLYDSITNHLSILRKKRSQELGLHLPDISRDALRKKTQRAEKIYTLFEEIGLDKIKLIKTYSANTISKFTNDQIREIIEEHNSSDYSPQEISSGNHVTEISETAGPGKILPIPEDSSSTPAKAEINIDYDVYSDEEFDDDVYFDEEVTSRSDKVELGQRSSSNQALSHDDSDRSHNNDSEEEMPDESDDDGYSGCGGYNEYGESDRGYYYDLSSGKKTYKNSDHIISAY